MYTGLDVFIIVIITVFFTTIIDLVLFSCLVANSQERRDYVSYMEGFLAGQNDKKSDLK